MKDFLSGSAFFGAFISLFSYFIGALLKKKLKLVVFNPILIAIVLTIGVLLALGIDYETYNVSAKYLSYFLTPATVCLAIPLYEQLRILKKNLKAIIIGILSGVLTSLGCVLIMAMLFHLSHAEYVTLLPKSITTAIGMPLADELGGYGSITAAVIILTGIIGNVFADGFLKLIRVREPVAKGIAIGTSAHAFGTARALEMGEIEGAMSSLSIAVAGLVTVVGASVFAQFL